MSLMKEAHDGLFFKLKRVRSIPYKLHKKIDEYLLGVESIGNLFYVWNSGGFIEVVNKNLELLGIIYYYKLWKKFVWEQCPGIIMSKGCLQKVQKIIDKQKENFS